MNYSPGIDLVIESKACLLIISCTPYDLYVNIIINNKYYESRTTTIN